MSAVLFAGGAASILAYIDTAVGVATFLMSERLPATVENIRSFFKREKRDPPPNFSPDEAQGLVALLIIDPDLLKDLSERVRKAIEAYRYCLRKAVRPQENDACDRRAERDICDTLNRIKSRNKGNLPTDILNNQWHSFGCVDV
ncbi:MAG: hypothetical protein EPN74_16900 [Rhodanobacter sp.]|nr:MAG: hypothetical protein EPN74_16900 [Rhodanobacter sp.]